MKQGKVWLVRPLGKKTAFQTYLKKSYMEVEYSLPKSELQLLLKYNEEDCLDKKFRDVAFTETGISMLAFQRWMKTDDVVLVADGTDRFRIGLIKGECFEGHGDRYLVPLARKSGP
ncbi:hypothetical protein JOC78_001352 [Bacillus ectoiniformans]|uniref:hypothetical protein n=1 Tax=Bacillus ectoiniformans TaxID=1494429 RepID=UPI00195C6257|nr:hypothetical protein [Bacillus ectoiniformans]MBM7648410.1 hypothetical protein [Bacillus ectoiniformans]